MHKRLQSWTGAGKRVGDSVQVDGRISGLSVARPLRLGALSLLALWLVDPANAESLSIKAPAELYAVGLTDSSKSHASIHTENSNDYVQVRDGKFVLAGKPFVIKGTNYFGSWRYHHTIDAGNGIEFDTAWDIYHDWDSRKLAMDFKFIRSQLKATTVRIGTPAVADFAALVEYHNYQPWFNPDGTITEQYRFELIKLADIAYANGIRIQFCLLWGLGPEMAKHPDAFQLGGEMDKFYAKQVSSIAMALRSHPGVIAYSIGNEVLVDWPVNGTHTSSFEGQAAGFIVRRLQELRAAAPRQLLTTDEGAAPEAKQWYAPGSALVVLPDVDIGNGPQPIRLADFVDYLGTHFYPETLQPEDLADGFASKIANAKQQLAIFMQAAQAIGKPVVFNEFGLQMSTKTIVAGHYSTVRDRLFHAIIADGQKLGLQGLLAWDALPEIALIPGQYVVKESKLNAYSPLEVDTDDSKHTQRQGLFYQPEFYLFEWRNGSAFPKATPAAISIASAWPHIPQPIVPPQASRP
jgi:hypothetical protein